MRRALAILACIAGITLLAGCGAEGNSNSPVTSGGSGGSGGGGSTATDMSSSGGTLGTGSTNISNASSFGTGLVSLNLQGFQSGVQGTSATYNAATSAAVLTSGTGFGSVQAPVLPTTTGTNSTVTLVSDATGNLSSLTFAVVGPNSTTFALTDAPTFTSGTGLYSNGAGGNVFDDWSAAPTGFTYLQYIAGVMNNINSHSGGGTYAISQASQSSQLTSSAYGLWAVNDSGTSGRVGVFAIGNAPLAPSLPTTGTATYNGLTLGAAAYGTNLLSLTGNIQLIANFGSSASSGVAGHSVATTISGIQTQIVGVGTTGTLANLTGTQSFSSAGTTYSGPLSGGGLSGTLVGGFLGSGAAETAGVWSVSGTEGGNAITAVGSYGAKP